MSTYDYNKKNRPFAVYMRKHMTPEERKLWYQCLLLLPIRAHRQKNIGNYIVDFYVPKNKVVIEADGLQHNEPHHRAKDIERDKYLNGFGITVLRYSNEDINDHFGWVARDILRHLNLYSKETIEEMRRKFRKRNGYKED